MEIKNVKSIVIRGTGKYATRLMEEILSYKVSAPDLYAFLMGKIYCIIDIDENKQGSYFFDVPVFSQQKIANTKSEFTFILAMADYWPVLEELEKDGVRKDDIISSSDFIRDLHKELAFGDYKIYDEHLKRKTADVRRMYRGDSLIEQDDAFATIRVKALFFMYLENYFRIENLEKKFGYEVIAAKSARKVERVGLFTSTHGGGGAERVVSNLEKIFLDSELKPFVFIEQLSQYDYSKMEGVEYLYVGEPSADNFDEYIDKLYGFLCEKQIDAVVFHMPYEGYMLFYKVLLCKLMGLRTIVEFHTSFINALRQRGRLEENLKTYQLADSLVVLSKTDEVYWRDRGVNAVYIPNPIISSCKDEKQNFTILNDEKFLIWVGRIDNKYKKVFDLIPIMNLVKSEIPDIKLYVIGTATNKTEEVELKKRMVENNLEDNIILCGFVTNVYEYYHKAFLMLMTSPGEGFPMVLAEAKSYGLPTVMYDLPYLELVKDERGIVTVEQEDVESFAQEVISLLKDNDRRAALSKQAIESADYFISYDIAGAWKNVFNGIPGEELDKDTELKERELIRCLLNEN